MPTPEPDPAPPIWPDPRRAVLRFAGLDLFLAWLHGGLPDPEDAAGLDEAVRACIARFAHRDDLPITVELWPLSRGRRFSVTHLSTRDGTGESLEVRIAPATLGPSPDPGP